jgi:hypothetical protein
LNIGSTQPTKQIGSLSHGLQSIRPITKNFEWQTAYARALYSEASPPINQGRVLAVTFGHKNRNNCPLKIDRRSWFIPKIKVIKPKPQNNQPLYEGWQKKNK